MLWACLRLPRLALEAVAADAAPARGRQPFAVVDGPAQRRYVVIANFAAQAAGVRAGQGLAPARLLCPCLATTPRDAAAERQALESLAACAYRCSADVHLRAPDALLFEIGASLKLFGGWPALQRRLRSELAGHGFEATLATAPTAAAAHLFAIATNGLALATPARLEAALAAVPLTAAAAAGGFDARTGAALHGMGLRRLGDLFRLPRPELARRIGAPALAWLDRLRGRAAETLPRWQPPARFERRLDFEAGVDSHGALAFPLQRLVRELALFLAARDGGVQRFTLALGHERGASTRIEVGLLTPQREATSLFELARARLERCELVAPVHALGLHANDLPPLRPLHHDLFEPQRRERLDWPALVERLRARLGDEALHGLACVDEHRPGRAWHRISVPVGNDPAAATDAGLGRRPFWLLRRPLALREAPARLLAGPERIESGWWDGHDQRRDYYVVELRSGQRAWAFTEAGTTKHWTLHGWFA